MGKVCLTTVSSANYFSGYIPLYLYSLSQAFPDYHARIFLRGKLPPYVKEALNLVPGGKWAIYEDSFPSYHVDTASTNALRFILRAKHFQGFNCVLFTDLDFIFVPTKPKLIDYHSKQMTKSGCFGGYRGPKRHPARFPEGWTGDKQRVAGGTFLVNQEWFKKTAEEAKKYRKILKAGKFPKYREADEVMLCNMIKKSGMVPPEHKGYSRKYRPLHVGDFKFARGSSNRKMARLITKGTCRKFLRLYEDPTWVAITELISKHNPTIRKLLRGARRYTKRRAK